MTSIPKNEKRCDLFLWLGDGQLAGHDGLGKERLEVSIGRTNSTLGLGFAVGDTAFVLDRAQVENLAGFLTWQTGRMRNSGRASGYFNFGALMEHAKEQAETRKKRRALRRKRARAAKKLSALH